MQEGLYTYLSGHLTPRKRELFDAVAASRTRHLTVVLEDIYQTQNASAILRSAESWGVQDIHVIENDHSFNFHRRISKGAYDWLTLHRYNSAINNTESCIEALKDRGYLLAATSLDSSSCTPEELPLDRPVALVMGTELSGISNPIREHCAFTVHIPMCGFTESLNVSVAAGVLIHSLMSRLKRSSIAWQLSAEEQLEIKTQWAKKAIAWSDTLVELYESGETGKFH